MEKTHSYFGGRGVLFVKSAGNDGKHSMKSDRIMFHQTVVSALSAYSDNPRSAYSSFGSNVFVSAPTGIVGGGSSPSIYTTTMRGFGNASTGGENYTPRMTGTSAAAPMVSGVAALMYSVNDQLTWRDVRHIFAKTSKQVDPNFQPTSMPARDDGHGKLDLELGWVENAAGYTFHNRYGFGMVDATKAVQAAANNDYQLLPPLRKTTWIKSDETDIEIPANYSGATKKVMIDAPDNMTVESVQVQFKAKLKMLEQEYSDKLKRHNDASKWTIFIISPSGTKSKVMPLNSLRKGNSKYFTLAPFNNIERTMLSNAFYGESSQGEWSIQIVSTENNIEQPDILESVSLRVYGH